MAKGNPKLISEILTLQSSNLKANIGEGQLSPPALELKSVSKSFGDTVVVCNCSLRIERGEIFALLGPSGCGKTTLLNIIAGFESPESGDVFIGSESQTGIAPNKRNVGMVFQNYALFPHMNARQNIAYGLAIAKLSKREIDSRVKELATLLKINPLLDRYPNELSGGQRQRVAIARALARRPGLLLLDEAMSALDKNLREEVQIELSLLLRRLAMTAVLVTHDQREAFTLADRIAVMRNARIEQIGRTQDLFERPASPAVLEFLGAVNRISASAVHDSQCTHLDIGGFLRFAIARRPGLLSSRIDVYLPYTAIGLSRKPTLVHQGTPARIDLVSHLGTVRRYYLSLDDREIVVEQDINDRESDFTAGDLVFVNFDSARLHYFS